MVPTSISVDTLEGEFLHPGRSRSILIRVDIALEREHGEERNNVILERDVLAATH